MGGASFPPSLSAAFSCVVSFSGKVFLSSKKKNLNFPYAGDNLHSIYLALGLISNLEVI